MLASNLLFLISPQLNLSKTWDTVQRMMDGFMDSVPRLILAIIVASIFYVVGIAARLGIDRLGRHRRRHNLSIVAGRLASATIVMVGILIGLTVLTPSFRAGDLIKVLGIGSVAIGFAFQNILQNFLAGILLLWSEPFRIDDQIKVDNYEGTVEEIQARATVVRTYDGRRVVIPNADLFTHSVTVNTAYNRRRWEYDFSVSAHEDVEGLKRQLVATIRGVQGVLADPPPQALIVELGDDAKSLRLRVWWWTHPPLHREMLETHDRVLAAIQGRLRDAGDEKKQDTDRVTTVINDQTRKDAA